MLWGIQRSLLHHVHHAITIHVGDGTRRTESRKAHLAGEAAVGFVSKETRTVVDQQPVVVVKDLGATGVVIAEVQIQITIAVNITRSHRTESRPGCGVHFGDTSIFEAEALPTAT